jgi:hypothetical protein
VKEIVVRLRRLLRSRMRWGGPRSAEIKAGSARRPDAGLELRAREVNRFQRRARLNPDGTSWPP